MGITVKAICYKSKVLSNNESPLMLRVTKDRKLKYVSLGISLNPAHWDFSKNEPKADCPNREYIEMLIADKIKEYSAKIIELKATNQEFTSTSLVEKVNVKRTNRNTEENVFQEYMTSLIKAGRKSYALSIKQLYNSLKEFCHSLDFYFSEMDVNWLKRYELFLREQRLAENFIHSQGGKIACPCKLASMQQMQSVKNMLFGINPKISCNYHSQIQRFSLYLPLTTY